MRKIMLLFLFSLLFISFSRAQYVTLEGRQFKDENGNDFYPVVCNFIGNYLYSSSQPEPFFPTPNIDHDVWCYDCSSLSSCLDQFSANFKKLKEMNFNAIRLYMLNPEFHYSKEDSTYSWTITPTDYNFMDSVNCWVDTAIADSLYKKTIYLSPSFETDSNLELIFQYYDSVLLRASRESLKVILNVGVATGDYSVYFMENYWKYLALVGKHFNSECLSDSIRQSILAYSILEEPCKSWNPNTLWPKVKVQDGHSKQDVCQYISTWYDTLKFYDPNHLITVGITPFDFFEFDPGVMKIDFASPHIYTQKQPYEGNEFFQEMLDQGHGWFYWLANSLPMPYLIGETGFRSKYLDTIHPGNQGTNLQQKLYADSTLKYAKDCKSSGYSWWYYQDYDWHNAYNTECSWGLLGRLAYYDTAHEKEVVNAFRNFNPSSQPGAFYSPTSYFDPYHHAYYAALFGYDSSHYLHGHVQDQNGNPIKNAYVRGQTRLYGRGEDAWYDTHHTFSDDSGNFVLIPFDYKLEKDPNYNVIETLGITKPGCSRFYIESWGLPGIADNQIYVLDCPSFSYSDTIENIMIGQNEKHLYQAWDNLLLFDSIFVYGTGEFFARSEVSIKNEFQAYSGSETWIYNSNTFPVCDSISPDKIPFNPNSTKIIAQSSEPSSEKIDVSFLLSNEDFRLLIFPNPSYGIFTVQLPEQFLKGKVSLSITDQLNRQIKVLEVSSKSIQVDLSTVQQGIYYLIIKNPEYSSLSKIIIL